MENFLKEFDRDVEKKSISPYRKWAYVETFACFVMNSGDLFLGLHLLPSYLHYISANHEQTTMTATA
jgi:hypothetical protein